jgi:hypothetical protein
MAVKVSDAQTLFDSLQITKPSGWANMRLTGSGVNGATVDFYNVTTGSLADIYADNARNLYLRPNAAANLMVLHGLKMNVGIGTIDPEVSSIFDCTSTTQGFLPPRMTEVQRDAIGSPATGLVVYNTNTNALDMYNGGSWAPVGGGAGSSNRTTASAFCQLTTSEKLCAFDRVTNIAAANWNNKVSQLIAPYAGTVSKVIVSVKHNITSAIDGDVTVKIWKNADSLGIPPSVSTAAQTIVLASDSFVATNTINPVIDTGVFTASVVVAQGDLIQVTLEKELAASRDTTVTVEITES